MKITLDIPNTTMCAFFDFVYYDDVGGFYLQGHSIQSIELYDGAEITIPEMTK